MSRDRNGAQRAQARAGKRKAAKTMAVRQAPQLVPHTLVLAKEGTHLARDGKPYTITLEKSEGT